MSMTSAPDNTPEPSDDLFAEPDQTVHMEDVFGFGGSTGDDDAPDGEAGPDDVAEEPKRSAVGADDGEGAGSADPVPEPPVEDPDEKEMELVSLRQQLKDLREAKPPEPVADPAPAKQTPAPEPTPAAPTAPPERPPVNVTLPAAFKAKMFGTEEEAGEALDQLVSQIYTQVDTNMAHLIHALPQLIAHEVQKLQPASGTATSPSTDPKPAATTPAASATDNAAVYQKMETDYFAAFPAHNKQAIRSIISEVNAEMRNQFPGHPFDAKYIASLGSRVNKRLAEITGELRSATPHSLPPGSRSADPGLGDGDISEEVLNILR